MDEASRLAFDSRIVILFGHFHNISKGDEKRIRCIPHVVNCRGVQEGGGFADARFAPQRRPASASCRLDGFIPEVTNFT